MIQVSEKKHVFLGVVVLFVLHGSGCGESLAPPIADNESKNTNSRDPSAEAPIRGKGDDISAKRKVILMENQGKPDEVSPINGKVRQGKVEVKTTSDTVSVSASWTSFSANTERPVTIRIQPAGDGILDGVTQNIGFVLAHRDTSRTDSSFEIINQPRTQVDVSQTYDKRWGQRHKTYDRWDWEPGPTQDDLEAYSYRLVPEKAKIFSDRREVYMPDLSTTGGHVPQFDQDKTYHLRSDDFETSDQWLVLPFPTDDGWGDIDGTWKYRLEITCGNSDCPTT